MMNNNLHNVITPNMIFPEEGNEELIVLEGQWTLRTLAESIKLRQAIKKFGIIKGKRWDLSRIQRMDSAAAFPAL
jgi:phospholipid/cholesterol/gamma-HCH transport system permease protein